MGPGEVLHVSSKAGPSEPLEARPNLQRTFSGNSKGTPRSDNILDNDRMKPALDTEELYTLPNKHSKGWHPAARVPIVSFDRF